MAGQKKSSAKSEGSRNMLMWDARFSKKIDNLMHEFNCSLNFDKELFEEDIKGSIAWANALMKAKIISLKECKKMEKGLNKILDEIKTGKIEFNKFDEDIHMAVERMLTEKIGKIGEKLHTGRSRNDQVVTDLRMYVMNRIKKIVDIIKKLQKSLLLRAKKDINIIFPSYTHLQQAQPILLSHYWLSFIFAIQREKQRFVEAINASDLLPLGSGAVAGSGFDIDRKFLAKQLGFSKISNNSIDAVSSRDFVLQALGCCSSCAILLSRYAEDLIIWSSKEFNYIELDDAWATGSSMMPQKKNPDSLELIRAKAGRLIGNYTRFASTSKGVGLAYYKDLQEDKESLFDSIKTILLNLEVFTNIISTLKINEISIKKNLDPMLFATDLADYLVAKGMPFRSAHKVVGSIVSFCIKEKVSFDSIPLNVLKKYSDLIDNDVRKIFTWENAIKHRSIYGGTSRESVLKQIKEAEIMIEK